MHCSLNNTKNGQCKYNINVKAIPCVQENMKYFIASSNQPLTTRIARIRYFISVKSTTYSHLSAIYDSGRFERRHATRISIECNARMPPVFFACFMSCMMCFAE